MTANIVIDQNLNLRIWLKKIPQNNQTWRAFTSNLLEDKPLWFRCSATKILQVKLVFGEVTIHIIVVTAAPQGRIVLRKLLY